MVSDRIMAYSELIMLPHSIFSLPYGIVAALLAGNGRIGVKFWIVSVALVAARSAANAFNRFIDRRYDLLNPRTRGRQIPSGKIKPAEALVITAVCFVALFAAAAMLGPWCIALFPFAVLLCVFYSFTKRFTWTCHFVLGVACSLSPLGAYLGVYGGLTEEAFLLASAVGYQVAAFDVLYATYDIEFDRMYGLYSVPQRFGAKKAIDIASVMQLHSAALFAILFLRAELSGIMVAGIVLTALIMLYSRRGLKTGRGYKSVYRCNAACTVVMSVFTAFAVRL